MKRHFLRATGLGLVAFACAGCARFPSAGNAGNFTTITFTFSVASQINLGANGSPPYIYDVAIRAIPDMGSPVTISTDPKYAPIPTIDSSNPNGRMNGSPTNFIEFNPGASPEFTLYRFALASEVPPKYDPTNPINLGVYAISTRGIVFNPQSPLDGGDQATLSFTLHTNELADSDEIAKTLRYLQVNILTMTRPSNLGSGPRIIDGLGDSSTIAGLTNYIQVDLLKSGSYTNVAGFEPTGDTYGGTDPAVDIVNYTITISPAVP